MNRKGYIFYTDSLSIAIIKYFAVSKVTVCVLMLSFGIDTGAQLFCHSFIALPMIHCSKSAHAEIRCFVSSRYCCCGNHTAGSKPI